MMFLVSDISGTFNSFGGSFHLEPIKYPDVNIADILVVEDTLGKRIMRSCSHILEARFDAGRIPGFPKPMPPPDRVPDGSRIVILRGGGIGDLIMLIPALQVLKRLLPGGVRLYLATFQEKTFLFKGMPELEGVMVMPARMNRVTGMDFFLDFSGHDALFRNGHMTDFYLACMGLPHEEVPVSWKRPWLSEKTARSARIRKWFRRRRRDGRKQVYLHLGATDIIRRLPPDLGQWLARSLPGADFVMSPGPGEETTGDRPPNLFFLDTGGSLSDYMTAIACADAVVSTDSSAYHIAAGFQKPAIALFGPVPSAMRTRFSPTVVPIDAGYRGKTCASPCGLNAVTELRHRPGGPGYDISRGCPEANLKGTGYSPCLLSIPREEIRARLVEIPGFQE